MNKDHDYGWLRVGLFVAFILLICGIVGHDDLHMMQQVNDAGMRIAHVNR